MLIRSVVLQAYEQSARSIGVDPFRQMRQAGLVCEAPIPGETFVPQVLFARLLEDTALAGGCPDFGLRMAQWPDEFLEGPLVLLMRHSPTLRDALALLERYSYVYSHDLRPTVSPVPDATRRVDLIVGGQGSEAARAAQANEFTLASLLRVLRHVQGRAVDDWEILLAHGADCRSADWRERLDVACRYGMPYSALRLPVADLERPLPARNDLRLKMAVSYIETHYRKVESVSEQVRRLLRQRLGSGAFMQGDIAAALSLHEKTLQRRLAKEGRGFPSLLDEVRREAFVELLRQPGRPGLAQIAQMLGYSEQAALSRSCQRWFGCSPSEMLRRHQAGGAAGSVPRRGAATTTSH